MAVPANVTSKKDAEGEFLHTQCGLTFVGASGGMFAVTAGGKRLCNRPGPLDVRAAFKEFQQLPKAEREAGAVRVAESIAIDQQEPSPPPGGLILKVYHRYLGRDDQGRLRHITRRDFLSREQLVATFPALIHNDKGKVKEDVLNFFDHGLGEKFKTEAAQDFLWLTAAEWRSLIPAQPKKGDCFEMAGGIAKRIFLYQLDPVLTFGESNGWMRGVKDLRDGRLTLTVEEVSADRVRLRLEGFALLGQPFDPSVKPGPALPGSRRGFGYEPRLLGLLDYDRDKQAIARFDMVAVGDMYGYSEIGDALYFRPGRNPLGVAFELTKGELPAERVPPRCYRGNRKHYFAADK